VSFLARTLDVSEETVRKIEALIWASEIRDQSGEFPHHTINSYPSLFKGLVALWDDLVDVTSG
jgi:hypothetical protein